MTDDFSFHRYFCMKWTDVQWGSIERHLLGVGLDLEPIDRISPWLEDHSIKISLDLG